ncbi:spermidine synthase [Thermopolyspora sp. NPDC052614]|uniref:spermine/spermidine synthase domain-containing protein n=1 Tax=Thermopolyspora sp. NPDC052614 TaxID=3155682 RepID=UPI003446A442
MTLTDDRYGAPKVLDRVRGPRGESVLRQVNGRFEIISNGVFLMDTSDGTSERLLIDAALARCAAPRPRLLIGGLGVGFSLVRAIAHKRLAAIDVVEIEASVIDWHHRFLRHITGAALADPRVRVIESDILDWLDRTPDRYDAICLDTDNGSDWLVFETNADIYADRGMNLLARRLRPGGVLAVWCARPDPAYEQRLRDRFNGVETVTTPRPRGCPDLVYVARACAR